MTEGADPIRNGIPWRMQNAEHRLERIEGKLEEQNVAVLMERLGNLRNDVQEMRRTMTWILRSLVGLACMIIAGVLVYAATTGIH